ncbi:BACON domain-containing protein [Bacteroides heparinolyticus]|uniref:Uncharacterized protein n=2 Tax=Prevotella heparinolytica TaxID=28113 RepID=A0A3P2A346_9BACE|nr:BACON domain-containing carbohydrate-binding protein [Bacteroides heparinolyticus]RRD88680.1 hypothetical protein EII33_11720 [Bacteroides heparinolyticus]
MQKRIMFGVWLCFILLMVSCGENHGYSGKIIFEANGGSRMVSGEEYFDGLEITDYNGDGKNTNGFSYDDSDSVSVTYQWLTVKGKKFERDIVIVAEPNETGKKRELYVAVHVGNSFDEIKVVQTK